MPSEETTGKALVILVWKVPLIVSSNSAQQNMLIVLFSSLWVTCGTSLIDSSPSSNSLSSLVCLATFLVDLTLSLCFLILRLEVTGKGAKCGCICLVSNWVPTSESPPFGSLLDSCLFCWTGTWLIGGTGPWKGYPCCMGGLWTSYRPKHHRIVGSASDCPW